MSVCAGRAARPSYTPRENEACSEPGETPAPEVTSAAERCDIEVTAGDCKGQEKGQGKRGRIHCQPWTTNERYCTRSLGGREELSP
eukprot:747619-Hanusia_phi.AAC.1